ncbi:uncharacterized protein [Oscarella lobularis]|uniref:uncharacterized protein isoform X2 n=1 Tax=Oscarella lobularis TaxID=121494 RepID=UPI003313D876
MDVNPTSDVVVKTVARKLRHYIDVQRREQGFDLSGPKKPPNVLKRREFREGVSRTYHTHRDRRLKHSFAEARVKTHRDVDAESTASSSQSIVRIGLEEEMDRLARIKRTQRSRTWRRSSISSTGTPTSPPPPHPTKKSGRAQSASPRKQQPLLFHRLSRGSAERLLSTASKLIVATEVVALTENLTGRRGSPDQVRLPTVDIDSWSRDDSPTKSRQDINLEDISGYYYEEKDVSQKGNSSNNDQNETKSPPPPPPEEQQPSSIKIKLNEASSQYTRSDSYLYRRATLDPLLPSSHGDSNDCEEKESTSKKETDVVVTAVASLTDVSEDERSDEKDETSNGQEEDDKEVTCDDNDTQEKSIEESDPENVMKSEETQTQTNEEEQEKNPIESSHQEVNATGNGTSPQALSPTPSLSTSVAMVDSFTQTPNHKATQTANSFADTPVRGEQEALTFSSPENVLQEASRVLQLLQNLPTRVEYQIEVHTGSEPLAGTTAKIFVNIYGEAGNSGPRELSRKNESYFQRNQVDIFTVSSSSLGKIKGIKVWHDNSGDAPDWFLEKIVLREGGNNSIADFLFECRKWLKSDSNQKPYEALYPTEIILKGVASSELEAVLLGSASSDSLRASSTFYPSPAAAASSATAATSFQARNLLEEFGLGHDWQAESQRNQRRRLEEESVKVETKDKDDEEQDERTRAEEEEERERLKKEEDENEREERAMRKAMEKIGEEARQKALIRHASAVKIQEFLKGFAAGSRALKADPKPIEEKLQEKIEDQEGEAEVEEDEDDEDEDEEQQILSMLSAAKKGDAQKLESLLNRNSSLLKIKGEHGWSPLHEASLGGHTECVKFLVSCGANLYEFTPTGYAPIHLATINGHIHCLQLLKGLGCGLSFRAVDDKTPLHLAAERGYIECCRWLIANRANLTAEDNSGRTPVALAEENDHDDCATLLRECGKELKRKSSGLALVLTPDKETSSSAVDQSALRPMSSQQSKVQRKRTTSLGSTSENDEDDEGWKSDENVTPETRKEIKHPPGFSLEEKRSLYDRQQLMMRKQDSSFLDSIRNEVEDEVEEEQDSRTDKEEKERDGEHSSEEERD